MDPTGEAGRLGAGSGIDLGTASRLAARGCPVRVILEQPPFGRKIEELGSPERSVRARYFRASAAYAANSGKCRVEGERVVHEIEHSSFPGWIDTNLVRNFEFRG